MPDHDALYHRLFSHPGMVAQSEKLTSSGVTHSQRCCFGWKARPIHSGL
jgi:hypothetical protein